MCQPPAGTFSNVTAFGGIDALFAHNGGTITGTGNLELDVTGDKEFHVVHADGTGSPPGLTAIDMEAGKTVIDMTQLGPANANARGVHVVNLSNHVAARLSTIYHAPRSCAALSGRHQTYQAGC
jgi:hypothetical protein